MALVSALVRALAQPLGGALTDFYGGVATSVSGLMQAAKAWFVSKSTTITAGPNVARFDAALSQHLGVDAPSLDLSGEFTFSVWAKPTDTTALQYVFEYGGTTAADEGVSVGFFLGSPVAVIGDGTTSGSIIPSVDATAGEWVHLVLTRDSGNNVRLYADGAEVGVAYSEADDLTHGDDLCIACLQGSSAYMDGQAAHLGFWTRNLSAQEINALYQCGELGYIPSSLNSNLANYWPMEEALGVRYDIISDDHAFDTNGVSFIAGPHQVARNVASFDSASSQYVSITDASQTGLDSSGNRSLSAWVKFSADSTTRGIASKWLSSVGFGVVKASDDAFAVLAGATILKSTTIADGGWAHVVAVVDGVDVKIYVNGEEENSSAHSGTLENVADNFTIGAYSSGDTFANGEISNVAMWSTALSDSEIATLYNEGNPSKSVFDKVAHSSQISFWPLAEPSGVRFDSWGSNHLTDNNSTGSAQGPSEVYIEQAPPLIDRGYVAKFNTQYLTATTAPDLSGDFAFSLWFKPESVGALQYILWAGADAATENGVSLRLEANRTLSLYTRGDSHALAATDFGSVSVGTWYHVAFSRQGSTVTLYLNGVEKDTATVSGDITPGAGIDLGAFAGASTADMQASHVAFWGASLAVEDIQALYNQGEQSRAAVEAVAVSDRVSYWPLHESVAGVEREDLWGTNTLSNTGDVGAVSAPDAVTRKVASFNGLSSQHLNITDANQIGLDVTGNATFAVWVKMEADGATRALFSKYSTAGNNRSYALVKDSSNKFFLRVSGDGISHTSATSVASADNSWQLVVGVYDGTDLGISVNGSELATVPYALGIYDSSVDFSIGQYNTASYARGEMAHAAIWGRALSRTEILKLYNNGSPAPIPNSLAYQGISYFPLCEESGDRHDLWSTNHLTDNNGVTSVDGATDSVEAYQEPVLKTDLVASFDSANSESLRKTAPHNLGVTTGGYSLAMWVKIDSVASGGGGLASIYGIVGERSLVFQTRVSDGFIRVVFRDESDVAFVRNGTTNVCDNAWHHVGFTLDGSTVRLYVDGVEDATIAQGAIAAPGAAPFALGRYSSIYHEGEMAHAAVWNRALSAGEFGSLYDSGSMAMIPESLETGGVSYWPLWEPRGIRYDRWGSNHLTDFNTVGVAHGPVEVQAGEYAGITKWENQGLAASPFADVVTPTAIKSPQLLNGLLTWDGVNSASLHSATGTVSPDSAIYVVARADSDGPAGAGLVDSDNSTNRHLIYLVSNYLRVIASSGDRALTTNDGHDRFGLYAEYTTTSITAKVGGETFIDSSASPGDMIGLSIGAYYTANGAWDGTIEAVLVFDRVLTSAELASLESLYF